MWQGLTWILPLPTMYLTLPSIMHAIHYWSVWHRRGIGKFILYQDTAQFYSPFCSLIYNKLVPTSNTRIPLWNVVVFHQVNDITDCITEPVVVRMLTATTRWWTASNRCWRPHVSTKARKRWVFLHPVCSFSLHSELKDERRSGLCIEDQVTVTSTGKQKPV